MVSRFSQLSVSNHLDGRNQPRPEGGVLYDDDSEVFRRGSGTASTSYGDVSNDATNDGEGTVENVTGNVRSGGGGVATVPAVTMAGTATSMANVPTNVVLCDLRHDAFEASVPCGPSDSGLVSKWRPKDRVMFNSYRFWTRI